MGKILSITAIFCCFFVVGCSDDKAKTETTITSGAEMIKQSELPTNTNTFIERDSTQTQHRETKKTPEEIAQERRAVERQEALHKAVTDDTKKWREKAGKYAIQEGGI